MRATSALWFVLAAMLALPSMASAQDKVTVGMASGVNQVTSLVAEEKGYFKEEGLNVDRRPVPRGNLAVEAIAAGSMQFAEVSDVVFFSAVTKGIPLVALGAGSRGFTGKMVAAPDHKPVKTLADLKGERIGIQVGTGVDGLFKMLLEKEGLKESDYKVINVRVVDMPAAMTSSPRPFDVVFGWDPMMQRIVQAGKGKEIISAQQFQDMAGVTYPLLLVADKNYIAKHHDTVQHFVNAYAKAQKYIRAHPDDALRMYSDTVHKAGATLDESIIKTMMFEVPKFGGVNFVPSDWTELPRSRDFLFKNGQIKSKPDMKDITDPSFADKAEAAIK
ncbi:MAG TPA: ABC transporter substrate-binding protein [Pseudolabrys sp.]|nr:ABC transporter substrate-binding protein [Pseudolabrys sp.]